MWKGKRPIEDKETFYVVSITGTNRTDKNHGEDTRRDREGETVPRVVTWDNRETETDGTTLE